MTTTSRRSRYLAPTVAATAAVLLAGTATAASAAPAFTEHWHDDLTFVHPDGDVDFCGDLGFDVVEHIQESGSFVGVNRGPEGLFFGGARFRGTITWTNPDNGRNYRNEYAGSDRDHSVTDNGDGTLTIQIQLAGPNRYYANGKLAFVDTGAVRFSILVGTAGTPTDPTDDVDLGFLGLDKVTGLRQTDGRDFCADITEFLG